MEEDKTKIVITGECIKCGVPTSSGRVYNREAMEKAVKEFNSKLDKGELIFGRTLDCQEDCGELVVSLADITHKVEKLTIEEDGSVIAKVSLLDFPKGQVLKSLAESAKASKSKFLFRPRIAALGNVYSNNVDISEIITVDFHPNKEKVIVEIEKETNGNIKTT